MLRNWTLVLFVFMAISGALLISVLSDQTAPSRVFAKSRTEQVMQTLIILNVSKRVIFVGENFSVRGFLEQQNGMMIAGRNVTVAWGTKQSIVLTYWDGSFEAKNLYFPAGFPQGFTNITATFGSHEFMYVSSSSFVQVEVIYPPSTITVSIMPERAEPLDQMNVSGRLLGPDNLPLQSRTVTMKLDQMVLGNTTTDSTGSFTFSFTVPEKLSNGTHILTALFNPTCDLFAPSNITLSFFIETKTITTITTPTQPATQLQLNVNPAIFSGMSLIVSGTISGTGPRSGNVTIYLDNAGGSVIKVNENGSFQSQTEIPISTAFGFHTIKVIYNSDQPLIERSEASATVFVLNTDLTAIATAGTVLAGSLALFMLKRRALTMVQRAPEPVPQYQSPRPTESTSESVKTIPLPKKISRPELLSIINLEKDQAAKVTRTYYLAQDLITERLGLAPEKNETHREYFDRVTKTATYLKEPLREVVELFEMVRYTPNPCDAAHSRQATLALLKLFKEIDSRPVQMEQPSV